jgi:hypothetical protein
MRKLETRIYLNAAPIVLSPIPDYHFTSGDPISIGIAGNFRDPDGDPLKFWSIQSMGQRPAWLTLDQASGLFSGSTSGVATGVYPVTVSATDPSYKGIAATFKIFVDPNIPPYINRKPADQAAFEDRSFSYQLSADTFVDPEGKPLKYWSIKSMGQMPAWLNFDQTSRIFSGTPAQSDVGIATITVSATDPSYKGAATTFKVTVQNTNDPPIVSAGIAAQNVNQRQEFRLAVPAGTFSDPDGDPLSLSLSSAPPWLSLSGGIISGTPQAEADCHAWNIGVRAADPSGSIADANFTLAVNNVNDPPYLSKPIPALPDIHTGEAFKFTVPAGTFTDPEGQALKLWSIKSMGQMPAWMSFDQTSGTFSGTPTAADAGADTVTVSATDPSYKGIATTFKINVIGNQSPIITGLNEISVDWFGDPVSLDSEKITRISDPDSSNFDGGYFSIEIMDPKLGDILLPPSDIKFGILNQSATSYRIDFNELSYPVELNSIIPGTSYHNTLDEPEIGTRQIHIVITDGDGGIFDDKAGI